MQSRVCARLTVTCAYVGGEYVCIKKLRRDTIANYSSGSQERATECLSERVEGRPTCHCLELFEFCIM